MPHSIRLAGKYLQLQYLPISWLRIDKAFLDKTVSHRMQALGILHPGDYLAYYHTHEAEQQQFEQQSNNSYSVFFRNSLTFSVIEQVILPMLLRQCQDNGRQELRFWTAACAAGQEAYSLAILLEELKLSQTRPFSYRIFTSDHQQSQLDLAQKGMYTAHQMENLSWGRLQKWFRPNGMYWEIDPMLRTHIVFGLFDLLDDRLNFPEESVFGGFDLIMAANVFYYYAKPFQDRMFQKIRASLLPSGYFVTGEVERPLVPKSVFTEKYPWSAIYSVRQKNYPR